MREKDGNDLFCKLASELKEGDFDNLMIESLGYEYKVSVRINGCTISRTNPNLFVLLESILFGPEKIKGVSYK